MKQHLAQQALEVNGKEKFSLRKRRKSFEYAWQGILLFLRNEHNARIHLVATVGVSCLAVYMHVNKLEAVALILSMAIVWMAEIINTALEAAMDLVSPARHPLVRLVKDMAAGAVLVAAFAAMVVGCTIFLPKIFVL
ncbi:MAG: diacylglycerol kinase [Flavisolibacter sp.]